MSFGNPWALTLFLLIPIFYVISRGQWVHFPPWRRGAVLALRLILLTLLILALADLRLLKNSDALSVIFLVDHSDSMTAAVKDAALEFVQSAVAKKPADDRAGIIVFGENAVVEEVPRVNFAPTNFASIPNTDYTNFADAIRLGMALFPADAPKRLILLSDGRNNLGDATSAAQLAQSAGIQLSVVNLADTVVDAPEVRLQNLNAPDTLRANEHFDLALNIQSSAETATNVQIFADGQLVAQDNIPLRTGDNRFLFPMQAGAEGFSTFRVNLVPISDTIAQNNRLDTFSIIEGALKVLVVSRTPQEAKALSRALAAANLNPQVVSPTEMPSTPLTLSEYAAVILVNLPAFSLSPAQLDLLQIYVRDLGKGLVAIGGDESFGAGGYFQTPLEETLPVDMTLKDRQRLPGMTMLMVIDKSGSMDSAGTMGTGGIKKIELAKEAVDRAVDLLAPWDRVGVIAFDNAARWVIRPEPVVDVAGIKNRVGTIRADGGTDILAGLKLAAEAIVDESSRVRHIVLLTDGGANPAGILDLTDELAAQDISISTVAIGDDYAPFLETVAERGNGRFHFARDASTIPQIFAQEATLALKAYLIEETFTPKLTAASPILQRISALPPLRGYVATSPKLTAQTVLVSHQDDPILAQWQYGLGRAVAFTSDASGRWGQDWARWDNFAQFWGQAVRWTIVDAPSGILDSQVTRDAVQGKTQLTVDALDGAGQSLNDLHIAGNLLSPSLEKTELTLTQVAPGRYQSNFSPAEKGAYLLRLIATDASGQVVGSATRGFVVNYSPEYAAQNENPQLMENLAAIGGGEMLSPDAAAAVFAHTLPPVSGSRPLWESLLVIFALLLPLDVGLRRVAIGREDWQKLAHRLRKYLPASTPTVPSPVKTQSSAKSLLSAKEKTVVSRQSSDVSKQRSVISNQQPEINHPEKPAKPKTETLEPKPETPPKDRMSRLLDAKKKARKK